MCACACEVLYFLEILKSLMSYSTFKRFSRVHVWVRVHVMYSIFTKFSKVSWATRISRNSQEFVCVCGYMWGTWFSRNSQESLENVSRYSIICVKLSTRCTVCNDTYVCKSLLNLLYAMTMYCTQDWVNLLCALAVYSIYCRQWQST